MGFSALHNFACKRQLESASYVTKCDQSNQSSSKYYLLYKSEIGIRKGVSACKAISNTSRRGERRTFPAIVCLLFYFFCFAGPENEYVTSSSCFVSNISIEISYVHLPNK